jgi:hypothetical protein
VVQYAVSAFGTSRRPMGFQDLPLDRYRAMIVRMGDLERSGIEQ